jgi:hypothetical protein
MGYKVRDSLLSEMTNLLGMLVFSYAGVLSQQVLSIMQRTHEQYFFHNESKICQCVALYQRINEDRTEDDDDDSMTVMTP